MKNPTLLTALLSAATIAGYVSYRLTIGTDEPTSAMTTRAQDAGHEQHADEMPALADSLPDVVLDDMAGAPTAIASFAGKPLLINFWATWCQPCLREIPLLKAFHNEHADIDVIGIAVDHLEPVLAYAEDMQFNYPTLVGQSDGMAAMAAFQNDSGAMPFSVYVAGDGAILGKHAGELHEEHLENFLAAVAALQSGEVDRQGARDMLAGLR